MVVPETVYEPPPYSCTRVRTETPDGVTSNGSAPGSDRTTTDRPRSWGRSSSQVVELPTASVSLNTTDASAARSAEIGDGQDPYGTLSGWVIRAGVRRAHASP